MAAAAWSGPVRACSCTFENWGGGRLYLGRDGLIPASAVGVPWWGPTSLVKSRDRVRLWRLGAGRPARARFTVVAQGGFEFIVPRAPLRPGDRYLVAVREEQAPNIRAERRRWGYPELGPPVYAAAEVVVGERALEYAGVELRVTRRGRQNIFAANHWWFYPEGLVRPTSCGDELDAEVFDVEVVLPPVLEPYRGYLLYRTRVDGQDWALKRSSCDWIDAGRSWTDRAGTDVLLEPCGDDGGTITRRVEVIVSAPGGKVLASAGKDVAITCAPRWPRAGSVPPTVAGP